MSSQKRMRTQSSAALEPDNQKKRELDHGPLDISKGGTSYDHDDPETKPMPAKDRDKLGVTIGSTMYCNFEIKPLYPSFFRYEIVFAPPLAKASPGPNRNTSSPSPAPPLRARHGRHVELLYICETCFKYTPHESAYAAHVDGRCLYIHAPPGQIVYLSPGMPDHPAKTIISDSTSDAEVTDLQPVLRKTTGYALYEIDGDEHKLFCQNLSLFAKLWVESKSVGFDVGGFTFYVLVQLTASKPHDVALNKDHKSKQRTESGSIASSTERIRLDSSEEQVLVEDQELEDGDGDTPNRIVGYFSKEKNSWDHNNLACILVFPPWQSMGIGQLLIEASYVLGEREGRYGGPERPLSESGRKSYESYWSRAVAESLLRHSSPGQSAPTVQDVATDAWIVPDDVITTLKRMGWFEGLAIEGTKGIDDSERSQKLIIDRAKIRDWLDSKAHREGLEPDGWLFDDETDEEDSSSEEDEDESEGDEDSEQDTSEDGASRNDGADS